VTARTLLVPMAGFEVELVIADTGERSLVIASDLADGGARRLVTRIPSEPGLADSGLRETRESWDLPLVDLRAETSATVLLVEALPVGAPSTSLAASLRLPPCAGQLARHVAAAHAAGALAGPLHPALIFVDGDGRLAAIGQRSLRARQGPQDNAAPLFGAAYLTPPEALGHPPTASDDVFRLAALFWRWRHGSAPFGSGPDEVLAVVRGQPRVPPTDDLDHRLMAAFDLDPARRPTALKLAEAAEAAQGN
jgi:hypothetical protein